MDNYLTQKETDDFVYNLLTKDEREDALTKKIKEIQKIKEQVNAIVSERKTKSGNIISKILFVEIKTLIKSVKHKGFDSDKEKELIQTIYQHFLALIKDTNNEFKNKKVKHQF